MDIAGFVWQIVKDVYDPAKRHASYLVYYRRNVADLRSEVESLGVTRDGVQGRVNAAATSGDRIIPEVDVWLTSVWEIENNATRLENSVQGTVGCFHGWCHNCCSKYHIGKEAEKKMATVKELQQRGTRFSVISYPRPPPNINSILSGDYVSFESREASVGQIMRALRDEEISIVGVYGIGGAGKTTLVKELGKRAKNQGLYQDVVFVDVSQKQDLKRIQDEIAGQLGWKIDQGSEAVRIGELSDRLKVGKTLVILDNLWEKFNLEEIGISNKFAQTGSKIIITTRNRYVCEIMKSQEIIGIGLLGEEEAWKLFEMEAGGSIDSDVLSTVGRDIARECGGLPLAIASVGATLQKKDKHVWNDALTKLKKAIPVDNKGKVLSQMELSYDFLDSNEIKLCFLFCCLFPEGSDIEIEALIRYGMGENFFQEVDNWKEARERMHTSIDKLKASCLLLESDRARCVKMHDVVRDMARSVASRVENSFLVKAGMKMINWPRNNLDQYKRISLIESEIGMLPSQLECPNLLTMLLQGNYSLMKIPDGFFGAMESLVVLDLSDTGISSPPRIKSLRALFLTRCKNLKDLSLLGEMEKLEILCLNGTNVLEFPKEIGRLSNLKLLDLSDTEDLQSVPPDIISKLQCLEELYMGNSFSAWEVEGKGNGHNASFAEVASLENLSTLYIHVENVECLSQEVSSSSMNLSRFHIIVDAMSYTYDNKSKSTSIMQLNILGAVSNWVKRLMERSEELELVGSNFSIVEWEKIFHGQPPFLKNLVVLKVCKWDGIAWPIMSLPLLVFENLRCLEVSYIRGLKALLPWRLAQSFQRLEELSISFCDEMEQIIGKDGLVDISIFPCLKSLKLENLPKLMGLCDHATILEFSSLSNICVYYCPNLKCLPLGATSAPNLGAFGGNTEWFDGLTWEDSKTASRFRSIFKEWYCISPLSFMILASRHTFTMKWSLDSESSALVLGKNST